MIGNRATHVYNNQLDDHLSFKTMLFKIYVMIDLFFKS